MSAVAGPSKAVKVEKVSMSPARGRKRLRRSAATSVKSYAVPDSDDEAIVDEKPDYLGWEDSKSAKRKKVESNLQRWIKHLTVLQKEEQKKVSRTTFSSSQPFVDPGRLVQGEEKTNGEVCGSWDQDPGCQGMFDDYPQLDWILISRTE